MKTKEELNALKEEVETVSKKLHELNEEELSQVSGGFENLIKLITGLVATPIGVTVTIPDHLKDK